MGGKVCCRRCNSLQVLSESPHLLRDVSRLPVGCTAGPAVPFATAVRAVSTFVQRNGASTCPTHRQGQLRVSTSIERANRKRLAAETTTRSGTAVLSGLPTDTLVRQVSSRQTLSKTPFSAKEKGESSSPEAFDESPRRPISHPASIHLDSDFIRSELKRRTGVYSAGHLDMPTPVLLAAVPSDDQMLASDELQA